MSQEGVMHLGLTLPLTHCGLHVMMVFSGRVQKFLVIEYTVILLKAMNHPPWLQRSEVGHGRQSICISSPLP